MVVPLRLHPLDLLAPALLLLHTREGLLQLLAPSRYLLANKLRHSALLQREIKPREDQEIKVGWLEVVLAIQIEERARHVVIGHVLTEVDRHLKVNVVRNLVEVKFAYVGVLQNFVVVLGQWPVDLDFCRVGLGSQNVAPLGLLTISADKSLPSDG